MADHSTVRTAARELGVSPPTLQRWIRDGAPVVKRGKVGRGHGALVDVAAIKRWRNGDAVDAVSRALWKVWRCDGGGNEPVPAWRALGVPEDQTLALLLIAFDRIADELGESSSALPAEMNHAMTQLVTLRRRNRKR